MAGDAEALLDLLRRRQVATGRELRDALAISQPTLSRWIARCRDELVVLGRTRTARYAARDLRSAFVKGVPLHRVDADGRVTAFGSVIPILGGQTAWLQDAQEARLFPSLPWFVEELRPQGFLGRLFVRASPTELQLPNDARLWSTEQLLRALVFRTDDLPGDLLVGQLARERYLRRRVDGERVVTRDEYADVIAAQLAGELPGSSAGGEQPKLACFGGTPGRHLLVKYSPPIAESPAARRWADLLRCEALALEVLRASGHASARAEYVEHAGRAYLEVDRFDRTARGRVAVVTGSLLDAEHVGAGAWVPFAEGLAREGRLAESDVETVRLLHLFGALIGNSDMHLGNIAFFTDDYERFRLAPAYDMLPMALRPTAHGELPRAEPPWPHPDPDDASSWRRAAELAAQFFSRVQGEPGLDAEVRAFAERRSGRVASLAAVAAELGFA